MPNEKNGLRHLNLEKLIEYESGVLAPVEREAVRVHLAECGDCSSQLEALRTSTASRADVLTSVLAGMEHWDSAAAKDEAVKATVRSELTPFLGPHGTSELMAKVSARGEDLLTTVEPVLALFLGCRAAALLVSQIMTHAILRAQ